jgi:arylsulfatase
MLNWSIGTLVTILGCIGQVHARTEEPKPRRNVILVICDQEAYGVTAKADFHLPAREAIARHGVTFRNHYIAAAMCSPSRAALLCGQPPQVTGVFDNMGTGGVPALDPQRPNMGSVMKGLGYKTAYFGKFEMDPELLEAKESINYEKAVQRYGFDDFGARGDVGSGPLEGYRHDDEIATEGVRWLRAHARKSGRPFFVVLSFLNPHDIMYANANIPGQAPAQRAVSPRVMPPLPRDELYRKQWEFTLSQSLSESLSAPGMPAALAEYQRGWSGVLGLIPKDRRDMWSVFYNYYLNCLQDNDRCLRKVIDLADEMDLWKDTSIIMTSDHGEMAGAHGGLNGKGPFCYEANAHVPLIIAHPGAKPGSSCTALTSHIDLLPTLVGLAGVSQRERPASVEALPGRDFSSLLSQPREASPRAVRPGILYNYVALHKIDADYLIETMGGRFQGKQVSVPLERIQLDKRGFLAFAFDGRYKLARYYSPAHFNTPRTLSQIMEHNDVQLFDLEIDPNEVRNLAVEAEKSRDTILRMNGLLNDLMAKEVGANDGGFLPKAVRPTGPPLTFDD